MANSSALDTVVNNVQEEFGGALSFGSVADLYDAARPDYPEQLIDAVLDYAALPQAATALEIGAGTGQATAQFAWRGLAIHAIEPSTKMVSLMAEKFALTGLSVSLDASTLESAVLPSSGYDLVFCATAWHWLAPRRRWEIVADVLRPGGTIAVIYHLPLWRETPLRPALDEIYDTAGAPLAQMGPLLAARPTLRALANEWLTDAPDPARFQDERAMEMSWGVTLTGEEYVELLGTYGDHIGLQSDVRERLFDGIVDLVRSSGGTIDLAYQTFLLLARHR
ncbi:MAG: class I SAM-dependent methyltransferase [Solirubrobacteraceae bacterium]